MLIQRATLLDGSTTSIRVGQRIEAVATDLRPRPGEDVLDAAHGTVLPGLHDHHVHLRAAAAALVSVRVGPPDVTDRAGFTTALASVDVDDDVWVRAVGYHESVAGSLDRTLLDAVVPTKPLRVQDRSGGLWTFNSKGLERLGLSTHPDGRVLRTDPEWTHVVPRRDPSLRQLSVQLVGYGVTGVTDATPGYGTDDIENLSLARRSGEFVQRLHCMATPDVGAIDGVTIGPVKRILDDSALDLGDVEAWIAECHNRNRAVAVHCVTDSQLVVTIAALRAAGSLAGDRIEHAAVVPDDCVSELRDLGITVVTQPNFVAERGDRYLADIPAHDHHELWRVTSLRDGGVTVALSTDFPYGDSDPWGAMRAAVRRTTATGHVLNAGECVSAQTALTMFLGHPDRPGVPRTVAPGEPGDLCVLSVRPSEALHTLDAGMVAATVIGGITAPRDIG